MMRRSTELLVGLALLVGCGKDPIKVLDPENSEGGDFGRGELLAAVEEFRKTPTSAQAYAKLRATVERLESTFDESNEELADRLLAFLALGPMEANANRPHAEQVEILASTVWPTVLGPPPNEGEGGRAYLDRVCADKLAGECRYIVPEMRGLFLGAKVWRRFRHQAQESYASCLPCQGDDSYRAALRRYDELGFPIESEAADRKGAGHPRAWPRAGPAARDWEPKKTIEVDGSGELRLSGKTISAKKWRESLANRQREGDAIGLYLRPGASVALLRDFAGDLATLGYREIRLQVREPDYPFALRYYPVAAGPGGVDLGLRATDTVQVAVLAMDQALERSAKMVSIY